MPNRFFIVYLIFVVLCYCSCKKTNKQPQRRNINTQEKLIQANRILIKKDKQRIEGHVKRYAWNMTETETGLWYEILKEGNGDTVKAGQVVTLQFQLSLLDGTLCYSSDTDGNKSFEVGHGGVETGLEQGILLCSRGTKARLILPPHLAYGLPGDGDKIPSRAILVYEIEVLTIENKNR